MVTDLRKCVGCEACTVACNAEWGVPPGFARTRVRPTPIAGTFPNLRSSVSVAQCNQCDRPPCADACPSGATSQRADGIVSVDKELCIGCGFCMAACPYDARYIHPVTKKADKCDFCLPRIERGEQPVCVATCTGNAKSFGDLEDRTSEVFRLVYAEGARRLETKAVAVGPNVYYLGKPEALALVAESFPPHAARLPAAAEVWRKAVKPLVLLAAGATFLGQAVAFFTQLAKGEKDFED
jgi:Fe-S-cluster-containing dehydrogenase component